MSVELVDRPFVRFEFEVFELNKQRAIIK